MDTLAAVYLTVCHGMLAVESQGYDRNAWTRMHRFLSYSYQEAGSKIILNRMVHFSVDVVDFRLLSTSSCSIENCNHALLSFSFNVFMFEFSSTFINNLYNFHIMILLKIETN